MIPKNTAKVVRFLLRNPEKAGSNINQIAKEVKISVGSAFKILKDIENSKIAIPHILGNAAYYNLDLNNPEAAKLCELLLLEEKRLLTGYPRLYSESIQKFQKAELVVLFGSVLTKQDFNDVDVLFITNKTKNTLDFCLELSKIRTKPVVPLILKKEDFFEELRSRNETIINIIKEGIVIKGESVFVEAIKNAKA